MLCGHICNSCTQFKPSTYVAFIIADLSLFKLIFNSRMVHVVDSYWLRIITFWFNFGLLTFIYGCWIEILLHIGLHPNYRYPPWVVIISHCSALKNVWTFLFWWVMVYLFFIMQWITFMIPSTSQAITKFEDRKTCKTNIYFIIPRTKKCWGYNYSNQPVLASVCPYFL